MPAAMSFSLLFSHSETAAPLRELTLIVNKSTAFEYILKDTIQSRRFTIRATPDNFLPGMDGHFGILRIDYNNPKRRRRGKEYEMS